MAQVVPVKNAFNGGELSPQMRGRGDLAAYQHSVASLVNWLPQPTGSIKKRAGSLFVAPFLDHNLLGRLFTFTYDRSKAYALLFTDDSMQVFLNRGTVLVQDHDLLAADVDHPSWMATIDDNSYFDGCGPLQLTTDDTLPSGWSAATDYYVRTLRSYFMEAADFSDDGGDLNFNVPGHQLTAQAGPFQLGPLPIEGQFGQLPPNIDSTTDFYVHSITDADNFKVSLTAGGAAIAWSAAFSAQGDLEMYPSDLEANRSKFWLATTPTGDPVDPVDAGVGTHTLTMQVEQPIQVPHPFSESEIFDVASSQIADLLWATHGSYRPRLLTRYSDYCWQFSFAPIEDGPYLRQQEYEPGDLTHMVWDQDTKLKPATVAVAKDITIDSDDAMFDGSDIGRLVRIAGTGGSALKFGWAIIREVKSATWISVDIMAEMTGAAVFQTSWNLSPWSDKLGWPKLVALHHQRVWYASTASLITQMWASQGGSLSLMAPDEEWDITGDYPAPDGTHILTDASGISYNVMIDQVNGFDWLLPLETLLVGSGGGVMRLAASELNEALTPDNPRVERISRIGCADIQPAQLDDAGIFVAQDGKTVMATVFDENRQKMRPHNLQRLTKHLAASAVTALSAMPYPNSSFWVSRVDGSWQNVVLDTRESVLAWSRQELGETAGGASVVESHTVLEGVAEGNDEIWMVVRRTINGATVRHVECLSQPWEEDDVLEEGIFMDSAIQSLGTPTSTITLAHLPNETVRVLVDGAKHDDVTLDASGQGTLDDTYDDVCAGLAYSCEATLLPVELPSNYGVRLAMKRKRVVEFVARVVDTLGLKVGASAATAHEINFRGDGALMDNPPGIFSGIVELPLDGGYGRDGVMTFVSDSPHPAEITELAMKVEVGSW